MKFLAPDQFIDTLNRIYATLKERINNALPRAEVDHIGSSAIVGAISKGDLDILVRVDKTQLEDGIKIIQGLGFEIKERTLRTESLCMLYTTEFNEDVAIQLIARGSEFEDFLRFRDRLNSNPELVAQYNQMKLSASGYSPNEYRKIKSAFIEKVLAD